MLRSRIGYAVLFSLALLAPATAGEPAAKNTETKSNADQAFERLKQLVGDWVVVSKIPGVEGKVGARYRLSGSGTAVVETLFPESPKEMITVYHRDGDQLVLTHYCCCGNQPRMRARLDGSRDQISFEFAGGSNLDPAKDKHMHDHRLRFTDTDHLRAEWDLFVDGKPAGTHALDLVRKK